MNSLHRQTGTFKEVLAAHNEVGAFCRELMLSEISHEIVIIAHYPVYNAENAATHY
jgi:hypothetical protein